MAYAFVRIQNASVKENIIFGSTLDKQKYETAVQVCELEQDVKILPDGDLTEIGEKVPITLSLALS